MYTNTKVIKVMTVEDYKMVFRFVDSTKLILVANTYTVTYI